MNQNSGNSTTSASRRECTHCGKRVAGGTYVQGVFYCPMCTSIIHKNNQKPVQPIAPKSPNRVPHDLAELSLDLAELFNKNAPDCCRNCGSNPANGGSGICHCTLPYMQGQGPKFNGPTATTHNSTSKCSCSPSGTAGHTGPVLMTLEEFLSFMLRDDK